MTSTSKLVQMVILLCILASNNVTSRKLGKTPTLTSEMKLDKEEPSTCFESLFQLQSCTSELVMFFLNGETYLGKGCCKAINVIQRDCWPNMLGTLGYTAEEGDILLGYCDASEGSDGVDPVHMPPTPPQPN